MPDISVSGTIQEDILIVKTLDEIFTTPVLFTPNAVSTFFDRVDDFVEINSVAAGRKNDAIGTISFRIKPDEIFGTNDLTPFSFTNASANSVFMFNCNAQTNSMRWFFSIDGVTQWLAFDNSISIGGEWLYFAIVQGGVTPKMYFQGLPTPTPGLVSGPNTGAWFNDATAGGASEYTVGSFGAIVLGGGTIIVIPHQGLMDEFRIWDVAKTDADILADHNGGVSIAPDPVGLVEGFRFGDDDGDIHPAFINYVSGNNGIMTNMSPASFVNDVSP